MIYTNFHTHTSYSDGRLTARDYVEAALEKGMTALGFSDHSPLPFDNPFSIKQSQLQQYTQEIRQLQEEYQQRIQLYLSLEMDYVPEMSQPFAQLKAEADLDYVIGSVHLVGKGNPETLWFTDGPDASIYDRGLSAFYDNDIKKGVKAFFDQTNEMIEKEVFDVIGHFDKIKMHNQNRYFTESEKWYRDHIFETLRLIQSKGLIVEINTRGIYKKRCDSLYPSGWILHEMKQLNIPILISSDAHHPDELMAEFPRAVEAAQAAGYQTVMNFNDGQWCEQAID